MTLQEQFDSFFEFYGLRNATYLRGDRRALYLLEGVQRLLKAIRKGEQDKDKLALLLASIFARTCAFADSFINLPIVDSLSEKYPISHCAYCGKFPCKCDLNRKTEITHAEVSAEQKQWSVDDWVYHLNQLYGVNNRERGVLAAASRLIEEITEAITAQLIDSDDPQTDLASIRKMLAHEFADIFAWIFALSALLKVNLEEMLHRKYGSVCIRCRRRPCNCGPLYVNRFAVRSMELIPERRGPDGPKE